MQNVNKQPSNEASDQSDIGKIETWLYTSLDLVLTALGRWWLLAAFLFALLFSVFLATPDWGLFARGNYGLYVEKQKDPWLDVVPRVHKIETHDAKINFRLTVPMFTYLTGTAGKHTLAVITALSIAGTIWMSLWLAWRETQDRVIALLFALFVTQLYVGMFGLTKLTYDNLAIFLLLLAFIRRPFWLPGVFVFLAVWCDERAYVASLVPLVYHAYCQSKGKQMASLKEGWPSLNITVWTIVAVLAVSVGLRFYLTAAYGLEQPMSLEVARSVLIGKRHYHHFGMLYSWQGGWLIALCCWYLLWKKRQWLLLLCSGGLGAFLLGSAFAVFDLSRALAFSFVALMMYFLFLALMGMSRLHLRRLVLLAFLCSLIMGNYVIYPPGHHGRKEWVTWVQPLPYTFYQLFQDKDEKADQP